MAAAAFALFSYSSFAHCGKCATQPSGKPCAADEMQTKCGKHSSGMQCKTECGMHASGCCDKCVKGECCKAADGKPCREKCGEGKGCCMKEAKCSPESCACKDCACKSGCKTSSAADPTKQEFAPDPVCGMDVTTKGAAHTHEYEGKTYYFCSESCKERFSKDPSKFLAE